MSDDAKNDTNYSFRLSSQMLEQVKDKAGFVPISVVIRELLALWLTGEVEIGKSKREL